MLIFLRLYISVYKCHDDKKLNKYGLFLCVIYYHRKVCVNSLYNVKLGSITGEQTAQGLALNFRIHGKGSSFKYNSDIIIKIISRIYQIYMYAYF